PPFVPDPSPATHSISSHTWNAWDSECHRCSKWRFHIAMWSVPARRPSPPSYSGPNSRHRRLERHQCPPRPTPSQIHERCCPDNWYSRLHSTRAVTFETTNSECGFEGL